MDSFQFSDQFQSYVLVDEGGRVVGTNIDGVRVEAPTPGGITIDGDAPDTVVTLYHFRPGDAGAIGLSLYAYPAGVTLDNLVPEACEQTAEQLDVTVTATDGSVTLGVDDIDGPTGSPYVWNDLPHNNYAIRFNGLPSGYDLVTIPEATFDDATVSFNVCIDADQPEVVVDVFFLQDLPSGGSVTVEVFDCPTGTSPENLARDACEPSAGLDLVLFLPDGTTRGLDEAEATDNVVTWSALTAGDYVVQEAGLPEGYTRAIAPEIPTSTTNLAAVVVSISDQVPDASFAIYTLPPEGGVAATDSDEDGLSDEDEMNLIGTDPETLDTDGDGRPDGDEIGLRRIVTDPLDPDSDDDGVDDGDEIVNETDPNDPASFKPSVASDE